MARHPEHRYNDDELTGLEIANTIAREWRSGIHQTVAQVTSSVHTQRPELPRSAVFWLAYHTIHQRDVVDEQPSRWPLR